ncbi:DUF456 domain-containing protein [candidate division KSB1 bacterium]|nr:DUF456 domain-containing protein [candidate division KSB1 bacterium]NIR72461.1 DUF456 domain-containing protein [candidate division KSB1 bacterium]NIS24046.1 DUF456 domain-containing protein [candidate division KSB1 bacterium]NIT70965.1 DUF456 domain-containing protein [candidate division KSB1 bacterium]NIU27376.1 DUF456 domain-containing protein [candidate division KSB1 bacterium]
MVLEIIGYFFFWLVMFVGIVIIPFGIPGTFVIVGNALIYAWLTDFIEITWAFLGILLLISIVAEVIEFFLGAVAAGKYGASRMGMFGAILGGLLGAIWGTPVAPLIGTVIGAFIGAFAGAALFEYFVTKDLQTSLKAGYGAFLGSVGGKLTKIAAGVAMVVMVGYRII